LAYRRLAATVVDANANAIILWPKRQKGIGKCIWLWPIPPPAEENKPILVVATNELGLRSAFGAKLLNGNEGGGQMGVEGKLVKKWTLKLAWICNK
jgi:hypothetical protein